MTASIFLIGFLLDSFALPKDVISIKFSLPLAILASLSIVFGFIGFFVEPKKRQMLPTFISYIFIAATISVFILEMNGNDGASPYILFWSVIALFVAVFGVWAYILATATVGGFVAMQYLSNSLSADVIIYILLAGPMPILISFFLWRIKSERSGEDKAYKNLASELSQIATQSEVIINAIGDGVLALDNKGSIALINPAAQTITGWTKADALGLSYKSILQLTDSEGNQVVDEQNPVQAVLNNNQQVINDNLTLITRSNKKIMISLLVSPLGEAGSGAIAVFRDITKQKTEEREQAEFISTASHEMRTPVASIEGYLGLALNPQTAQIDDKARAFINKAHESAQHLGRLFQDLLDVTKADDGRMSNQPKVVDIMQLTHDIVTGLQPEAAKKRLQLIFKPQPDNRNRYVTPVYYVNIDNDHIREIVGNLIENGIKYTENGSITVDVTGGDEAVTISVKDTGIGIPNEDIPHLFQKFYRVNNAETNQIGGTGLGLYLSRRLAETSGGRIWVESELRKGSTFYVEFPRISNEEAKDLIQEQSRQVASPKQNEGLLQDVLPPRPTSPKSTSETLNTQAPTEAVLPAITTPRGETLTPAQKAEQIAKLKAMINTQQPTNPSQPQPQDNRPLVGQPVVTRNTGVKVPSRNK